MKKYIVIISLILVAVAAYVYSFGRHPELVSGPQEPAADGPGATNEVSAGSFRKPAPINQDANGFPLMIGSSNSFVAQMQTALNRRFGSDLVIDGVFGSKTAKALSAHGFNPDAIYYKHYYQIIGG